MTYEQKAQAWKWAAVVLSSELAKLKSDVGPGEDLRYVGNVIIPHIRKQHDSMRAIAKAKRERVET